MSQNLRQNDCLKSNMRVNKIMFENGNYTRVTNNIVNDSRLD
jgi:hypothetical protein